VRRVLVVAGNDVRVWLRNPAVVIAAVVPPLALAVVVLALTVAVGRQPVALVVDDHGPLAAQLTRILVEDAEAFSLHRVSVATAERQLHDLQVAAIVRIPAGFDAAVAGDRGRIELRLNNVDIDFADDIRRAVDRAAAQFDAPDLGIRGELRQGVSNFVLPNPYRLDVAEHNLRRTNVSYQRYQLVPVLVLLILNVGLLSTGALAARRSETAVAKNLLLTPTPRWQLVTGHLLGGFAATALVVVPACAVAGGFGWARPPASHLAALVLLLGVLVAMAVSSGLVLASLARRVRSVTMIGLMVATYLFFLGGGFTTLAFLPGWVQAVAKLAPTSYAITGLRQLLFYPDARGVAYDVGVLAVVTVGLTALAVASWRRTWTQR
jgi:ABC-2 type transport system permease protein